MSNVICIKTRNIITLKVDFDTDNEMLNNLLNRFNNDVSLEMYPNIINDIQNIQSESINHPYFGDCVHFNKRDHTNLPFPIPNYSCLPQTILSCINQPDPLMYMDRKYKVTLNILKYATIIYTRSDLIAHDDYTAELKKDVKIYIVYNSTNADVNNTNEPGCPSYLRRVKAVDKLKDLGFNAILINEKRIKALKAV